MPHKQTRVLFITRSIGSRDVPPSNHLFQQQAQSIHLNRVAYEQPRDDFRAELINGRQRNNRLSLDDLLGKSTGRTACSHGIAP